MVVCKKVVDEWVNLDQKIEDSLVLAEMLQEEPDEAEFESFKTDVVSIEESIAQLAFDMIERLVKSEEGFGHLANDFNDLTRGLLSFTESMHEKIALGALSLLRHAAHNLATGKVPAEAIEITGARTLTRLSSTGSVMSVSSADELSPDAHDTDNDTDNGNGNGKHGSVSAGPGPEPLESAPDTFP